MLDTVLQIGSVVSWMDSAIAVLFQGSTLLDWINPIFAAEPSLIEQWGTRLYNIMLVALGLGFVIFVHELGHFLAAKAFGVKCEKFYVGFDVPIKLGPIRLPSKLLHFQWGETEYGIGAIPLGGYVKMLGQDDDPRRAEEELKRIRIENPNAVIDENQRPTLDPRSFPAKSVGARMVIISAGVIMNLIFGVLMAAWAFSVGVPYDPAIVGQVNPGDPAWMNGVQAGDKITQIGSLADDEMSFRDMFMTVLFQGLRDPKTELDVSILRNGTTVPLKFQGTISHTDPKLGIRKLSIGVRGPSTTQLDSKEAISKALTYGLSSDDPSVPKFQAGDIITGINGQSLEISKYSDLPLEHSLNELLHPRTHESVTVQVKRPESGKESQELSYQGLEVEWKPVPMKTLGLRFKPGKVSAILPGSPADLAGIKVGDSLVSINGAPMEDAFKAALSVAKLGGQTAILVCERADKTSLTVEWKIPEKFILGTSQGTLGPVGLELPGSGLVYAVSNVVSGVEPESMAAKNGFLTGDIIKQLQFDGAATSDKEYLENVFVLGFSQALEPTQIDNARSIHFFYNQLQSFRTGFPVKIGYERSGKIASAQADVHADSEWFWPDRGANFSSLQLEHSADSVVPALALGLKEIRRRMGNVLEFLELLVKGKMPFKVVGGPGMIAVEANDAASKGISPLLMFLVMLSANLAIVNFLPIPALDGGHMMFLTAEAILGRPVDEALQMKLTMVGVIGLLCLMAAVLVNDTVNLTRMFGG